MRPSPIFISLAAALAAMVGIECAAVSPPLPLDLNTHDANEALPLTSEELAAKATVVVQGVLESVSIERQITDRFDDRTYRGKLRVLRIEQGEGLAEGDIIEVRYWRRLPLRAAVRSSVAGYLPMPYVGDEVWLFGKPDPEHPGVFIPLLPNGWVPDEPRAADPLGIYGGTVISTIDERSVSLMPVSLGLLAAAALMVFFAVRTGPQTRPAAMLLAVGLAAAACVLMLW